MLNEYLESEHTNHREACEDQYDDENSSDSLNPVREHHPSNSQAQYC